MAANEIGESGTDRMTDGEIDAFLTERGVGVLGLPSAAAPYLLPMSFGYDGERTIYFVFLLFGTESRKQTLGDRAERASFLVYDAESIHEWRSVALEGRIAPVPEDDWDRLRAAMENAWHPSLFSSANPTRGVEGYRFRIDEQTGIRSAD